VFYKFTFYLVRRREFKLVVILLELLNKFMSVNITFSIILVLENIDVSGVTFGLPALKYVHMGVLLLWRLLGFQGDLTLVVGK
jgi:hypothetical protein